MTYKERFTYLNKQLKDLKRSKEGLMLKMLMIFAYVIISLPTVMQWFYMLVNIIRQDVKVNIILSYFGMGIFSFIAQYLCVCAISWLFIEVVFLFRAFFKKSVKTESVINKNEQEKA